MQNGLESCGADPRLWPLLCFELQVKMEQEEKIRRRWSAQEEGRGKGGEGGEKQQSCSGRNSNGDSGSHAMMATNLVSMT